MTSIAPNDLNPFSLDINLLADHRYSLKLSELLMRQQEINNPLNHVETKPFRKRS